MAYWLTSPQTISAYRAGIVHTAQIAWHLTSEYRWEVVASCPAFGTVAESADDAFEALCLVREQLEPYGWRLGVAGAQVDVWPSGQGRDQGGGRVAYRQGSPDLVEVFQPVDPETVTTVARQLEAAEIHYGGQMRATPRT